MLKQGDKAPAFSLESDGGKMVKLSDFKGKHVVVYFYPKDSTPGCTREAQAFSAARSKLAKLGATVVGVSKDSVQSHQKFRDKYDLSVTLLSDPDLKVHDAFGAYGEKSMYGKKVMGTIRSTFLIGPDGRVQRVWPSVKVDGHAEQVLAEIGGAAPAATKSAPKTKAPANERAAAKKKAAPKKKATPKKKAAAKKKAPAMKRATPPRKR